MVNYIFTNIHLHDPGAKFDNLRKKWFTSAEMLEEDPILQSFLSGTSSFPRNSSISSSYSSSSSSSFPPSITHEEVDLFGASTIDEKKMDTYSVITDDNMSTIEQTEANTQNSISRDLTDKYVIFFDLETTGLPEKSNYGCLHILHFTF